VRECVLLPLYILSLKYKCVIGMYSVPFLSKGSKFNYPKDKRSQRGTKCFAQECNTRVPALHWPHCYTKDTSQKNYILTSYISCIASKASQTREDIHLLN